MNSYLSFFYLEFDLASRYAQIISEIPNNFKLHASIELPSSLSLINK
jgi:hypothetical protein